MVQVYFNKSYFRAAVFLACLLTAFGPGTAQAQSTSQVTIVGIPPVLPTPFATDLENSFVTGQYQIIFNYTSFNNVPVDFVFDFEVYRSNQRIIQVQSLPSSFTPGTYVFTSFFEELVFPQSSDDVFSQLEGSIRNQIIQTGTLPEGEYSIRIEARPATAQTSITSLPGQAFFSVRYPAPPIPVSPPQGSNVTLETPVFAWMPVVNTAGVQMQYEFLLVEVLPGQTPVQAINSNQEHALETLVGNTTLPYTLQYLPLEPGAEYAWQVIASDVMGNVPLQNDGKTEIQTFTYMSEDAGEELLADISQLVEISLIPQFATLTGLGNLTATETPDSYILNGEATLQLAFTSFGAYQTAVELDNLTIQKQSLINPVLMGGSLTGLADQLAALLPDEQPWIAFEELSWSFGQHITADVSLLVPGGEFVHTDVSIALTPDGLSGTAEISGEPLVQYGGEFFNMELFSLGVSFPDNRSWATGNATLGGVEAPCELSNYSMSNNELSAELLCNDPFTIPLVEESELLAFEVERVLGGITVGQAQGNFSYDVELRSSIGVKTVNEQYCGSRPVFSLSSENGLNVISAYNYCPEFNPKIDLGFAKLQLENTELTELSYDSSTEEWNFELGLDAILEVDAFDSWTSLTMNDILLDRQGIHFDDIEFHEDSYIRPLPVFDAQLFEISLNTFSLNSFTFPLFDWDELAPGPWDIAFEGSAVVQNGFGAPMCLLGTTLELTNGRIDQSRVTGDLSLENFNGCEWTIGEGITMQIDAISGTAGVNYPELEEVEPFGRLNIAGAVTVGQPFTCDGLEPIAFEDDQFVISDGLEGTLENVIPGCPLDVGPFQAEVTQSNIVFSVDDDEGQQAIMNTEATLTLPDGLPIDGTAAIDLIAGSIKSASFIIDEPFDWHIPSAENPVLSFRINYAEVTGNGLIVEGRHELILPESNMGVTFEDFLFDLETLTIENGRIIFDDAFAFEAGFAEDLSGFDFSAVPVGSELSLDTGILMELAGTIIIDSQGLRFAGSAGIADAQVSFNGVDYESAVTVEYTENFRMSLYPFGVSSGQANFFYEGDHFAFADPSGFHPVWEYFADMLIPERLPLPTEDIAYIQLREDDELLVSVTENEDGNYVISSLPGQPLMLVVPYLNPANPPTLANISLNDLTITPNPFNPEVVSGSVSAAVPENDPQFDLSHLNIPLVPKAIEYGKRLINNVETTALYFSGDLILFDQQLADEAEVAFYIRGDGYVRADFDVSGMNTQFALAPDDQVTMGVDAVRGTFEMMIDSGISDYDIHTDGNLRILTEQGHQAGADLTIRTQSGGYTAITDFEAYAFAELPKIDVSGRFRLGLDEILSIENFSYTAGSGFEFAILFDMLLHIGLAGGDELQFPLREIEIRNDGFYFPTQTISEASIPGLNLPAVELEGFEFKPLALRTPDFSWIWSEWPEIGQYISMDFSVELPEFEGTGLDLPDGFLFTSVGFDDGYLTGSVAPYNPIAPIEIPLVRGGINSPRLLIDEIAGALGKLDIGGDFRQSVDFSVSGRLGEMPAFNVEAPELCSDAEFTLAIIEGRAFEGTITDMQPCGTLDLGPVTLEMTSADMTIFLAENEQQAELSGAVQVTLPVPQGSQPLVVSGGLTVDALTGEISDGSVSINQPFELNMPLMEVENPLFSLGIDQAELSAQGLMISGLGHVNTGDVNVDVTYDELVIGLSPVEIVSGSATIAADFAVEFTTGPFAFGLVATGSPMPGENALRMNLDAAVTLDAAGLTFHGSSVSQLQFDGQQYTNLRVELVDNFALNLNGLSVNRGRAEFYWDQNGQQATEPIAWIDDNGFHFGAGLIAFLPDRIPLPTEDIAYIDIKDEDGNPLISIDSNENGGYTLATGSQPLQLVVPALQTGGNDLEVDILFSLITDDAYNITGGSLDLQTEFSLEQTLNLPVTLTKLNLSTEGGLELEAGLRFDLPEIFNGMDEDANAEMFATLTENGIQSGEFFVEADPIYTFSVSGSGELSGDAFSVSLTKIEATFGQQNSAGFEGTLSSSLIMSAGQEPVAFSSSWGNNAWTFNLEAYQHGGLTIGSTTFQLDDNSPLSLYADDNSFYVSINGQVSFEDVLAEPVLVTVQELMVGANNLQSNPSLLFDIGEISGELGDQQFRLFDGAVVVSLIDPAITLTDRNLAITSDGDITFLEQEFAYQDLMISTSGNMSMGEVSVSAVNIFEEFLVLNSFGISFESGIRVESELELTLPAPADEYTATGIFSIYRDNSGQIVVDQGGLAFPSVNESFTLMDFGEFNLNAVQVHINPFDFHESGLYANANITIPTEDDPVIFFGDAGNIENSPGIGIAYNDGTIDIEYNITGNVAFEYELSFFAITVAAEMGASSENGFEILLGGSADINLPAVEANLDYDGIVVNENGLDQYGNITGGIITVVDVATLEVGQFIYRKDENGFNIDIADTNNENPDPEGLRGGNYDSVETNSITVQELICFGPCPEAGGTSDNSALELTISADAANNSGGISGGVEKIMFYKSGEERSLTIQNAHIEIDDFFQMSASINYVQSGNDILLRAAATGSFEIGETSVKAIVAGKFANINNQVSFGLFVAVEPGSGISIVPGAVDLTGAGGGFFYKPVQADLDMVHTALGSFGHELVNEEAASIQGEADFAVMLYASVGIGGSGGQYIATGSTYFQITSQAFYMDARAVILGMDGENSVADTKVEGEMSAHITRTDGGFTMAIGIAVVIEVPNVLEGNGSISFFMNKPPGSNEIIWGIVGQASFELFGGILDGGGSFLAGNPGFMLQVNLGFYADIAIMSIESSLEGAVWVITDPQYQYPFGAYIEFSVEASLMGLASVSASAQAAFVNKNPGYMFFAAVHGCVGTLLGNACGSAWVSLEVPGGINFGLGQNTHSNLIAQAQAMLDDFRDHILSLMAGIDGALDALNQERPPAFEVASAEDAIEAGANFYARNLYQRAGWDKRIHDPATVQSLSPALQAVRENVMLSADPENISGNTNYRGIAQSAIHILQGLQEQIDADMLAAYELEEAAQENYEELLSAVTGSPVQHVISPTPQENATQGVHFEVNDQQAASHATNLQEYHDEIGLMEENIRTNISLVLASLDDISTLLQADNPVAEDNRLINLAHWYGRAHIELERAFAYEADAAYKRTAWSDNLISYLNTNQPAILAASDGMSDNLITVVNAARATRSPGVTGTYGAFSDQVRRTAQRDYFIRLLKELPLTSPIFYDLDPGSGYAPEPTQVLFNDLSNIYRPLLTGEEQDMLRDLNRNFWWEMNHGGLTELNSAYWESVSAMRWSHQEERAAIFTPLIEMTQVLDDFYTVKANITSILYNMIDEYLQWKPQPEDGEDMIEDNVELVLGEQVFNSYTDLNRFLAIQLQPPTVSDISMVPGDISNNYFRETDIDWTASHQDEIVETSITVEYGGTGPGDMDLTGIADFMSVGNRDSFTIYPYKTGSRQFQNITFRLRARGSAGNTAVRSANFSVTVDPGANESDPSINTPAGPVVSGEPQPPAAPVLHLDNYYNRGPGPVREIEFAYWTSSLDNLTLEVSALDAEAGIAAWEYSIGTSQGGTDIIDWSLMQGPVQYNPDTQARIMTAPALSFVMEAGVPYYISVRVEDTFGQVSPVYSADPLVYDNTALSYISQDRVPTPIPQPGNDVNEVYSPIADLAPYVQDYNIYQSWTAKSPQQLHFRNIEAFVSDPRAGSPEGQELPVNYSGISHYEYALSAENNIPEHQFEQLAESFSGDELIIHNPDFEIGEDIYWHVRAVTHSGIDGDINTFGPYRLIDYTLPETGILRAKPYQDKIRVFVTDPPFDPESDLIGIQYAIGSDPKGGSFIRPFPAGSDVDLQWDFQRSRDLYFSHHLNYNRYFEVNLREIEELEIKGEFYIFYRSVNTQGMTSNIAATGPLMIDATPPPPPTVDLRYNYIMVNGVPTNRFRIFINNLSDPESGILKVEYWVERRTGSTGGWSDISSLAGFEHVVLAEYDEPRPGTFSLNTVFSPNLNFNNPNMEYRIKVRMLNGSGLTTVQTVYPVNSPFILP